MVRGLRGETAAPEKFIDISECSDIITVEGKLMTTRLKLTDLDALARAAECLRILAHPHRLRMVQMLLQGDFTVGELAQACEIPSPMASEHLRLMQRCGFLGGERDGRRVFYRVREPHLKDILKCVEGRFGVAAVARRPSARGGVVKAANRRSEGMRSTIREREGE